MDEQLKEYMDIIDAELARMSQATGIPLELLQSPDREVRTG